MPQLIGQFTDTAGVPIDRGVITVTLRDRLINDAVVPQKIYLPEPATFSLINGLPTTPINLLETESSQISTNILVEHLLSYTEYYKGGGELYTGPVHQWTDGLWYTDSTHTTDSVLLSQFNKDYREQIDNFDTIVPNKPTVKYSELIPTDVSTDRYPTTIRLLAQLLLSDQDYRQVLADNLRFLGAWDVTASYSFGNIVQTGGSSWLYVASKPSIGNAPILGSTYWQLFAAKGDPGGTGGDNTAFGPTWQNNLSAPSKNVVWAEFTNNRATLAQVNAKVGATSPALTGIPTAPTQAVGTGAAGNANKTAIATCEYVDSAVAVPVPYEVGLVSVCCAPTPPAKYLSLQTTSRLVSRTTYATLFTRLGITYSAGDGSTTFGLPPTTQLPAIPGGSGYWVISSGV